MHHVYIDNVLACARISILKNSQNPWCDISIEIVISTDLNPPNLTELEYESRNKLTTTSRDGLINMQLKNYCIHSVPMLKLKVGSSGFQR